MGLQHQLQLLQNTIDSLQQEKQTLSTLQNDHQQILAKTVENERELSREAYKETMELIDQQLKEILSKNEEIEDVKFTECFSKLNNVSESIQAIIDKIDVMQVERHQYQTNESEESLKFKQMVEQKEIEYERIVKSSKEMVEQKNIEVHNERFQKEKLRTDGEEKDLEIKRLQSKIVIILN
jgi:hypothetical protein